MKYFPELLCWRRSYMTVNLRGGERKDVLPCQSSVWIKDVLQETHLRLQCEKLLLPLGHVKLIDIFTEEYLHNFTYTGSKNLYQLKNNVIFNEIYLIINNKMDENIVIDNVQLELKKIKTMNRVRNFRKRIKIHLKKNQIFIWIVMNLIK